MKNLIILLIVNALTVCPIFGQSKQDLVGKLLPPSPLLQHSKAIIAESKSLGYDNFEPFYQGNSPYCTLYAFCAATTIRRAILKGRKLTDDINDLALSPEYLRLMIPKMAGVPCNGIVGFTVGDCVSLVAKQGCCLRKNFGKEKDCQFRIDNPALNFEAQQIRVDSATNIFKKDSTASVNIQAIKNAIGQGAPVLAVVKMALFDGSDKDDHTIVITGYTKDSFQILNSWKEKWRMFSCQDFIKNCESADAIYEIIEHPVDAFYKGDIITVQHIVDPAVKMRNPEGKLVYGYGKSVSFYWSMKSVGAVSNRIFDTATRFRFIFDTLAYPNYPFVYLIDQDADKQLKILLKHPLSKSRFCQHVRNATWLYPSDGVTHRFYKFSQIPQEMVCILFARKAIDESALDNLKYTKGENLNDCIEAWLKKNNLTSGFKLLDMDADVKPYFFTIRLKAD